jgi:hypothetical protein
MALSVDIQVHDNLLMFLLYSIIQKGQLKCNVSTQEVHKLLKIYNTRLLISTSIVLQSVANPERRSSLAEECTLPSINPSAKPKLGIKIHLVIHLDFHSSLWYLRAAPNINWFEHSIWRTQCRILNGNTVQRRLSEPPPVNKSYRVLSS